MPAPQDLLFSSAHPAGGTGADLLFGSVGRTDLVFYQAPGSADLVFGAAYVPPWQQYSAVANVALGSSVGSSVAATGLAVYDNRVTRFVGAVVQQAQQRAQVALQARDAVWGLSAPHRGGTALPFGPGQASALHAAAAHSTSEPTSIRRALPFTAAVPAAQSASVAHTTAVQHQALVRLVYDGLADLRLAQRATGLQAGVPVATSSLLLWGTADAFAHGSTDLFSRALPKRGVHFGLLPWGVATQAAPGGRVVVVPPTPARPYWGTALVFACPRPLAAPALVFGERCVSGTAPLFILPARFYMAVHSILAQRLPDLTEVPLYDATVATDYGSFCWTFSASGPASLFGLLAPSGGLPAQIKITLDGLPWVFTVDAISRTRQFGQSGVRLQGRSTTALLGAPYRREAAYSNSQAQLAQQLAASALDLSGASLDWGLADWLVPANVWSHVGTPLSAVQAIAQAAGGYVQSHPNEAMLLVRHPYALRQSGQSGAPWDWAGATPDVDLAPDALITESTERQDRADLNGVYVSGTTAAGVLALVKRTGTAADKLGSMVTDALLTDAIAARQRGLAVLGAAGSKHHISLELPVLTGADQPGVLEVGQLVQVSTAQPWRGMVRAVSVAAKYPSLRQMVIFEQHLESV